MVVSEGDVEMRGLMDASRTEVNVPVSSDGVGTKRRQVEVRGYKMSDDSLDSGNDSAKGGIGRV